LFDALASVVSGLELPERLELPEEVARTVSVAGAGSSLIGDDPAGEVVGGLRYEVMYFLAAPDEAIPAFKEVWAGIGDSIVVVGGDGALELPHPHQ